MHPWLRFSSELGKMVERRVRRKTLVPVRIEGDAIRSRQMTGVFNADDPSPMLRLLSRDPNVEVITSETEIVIRPR